MTHYRYCAKVVINIIYTEDVNMFELTTYQDGNYIMRVEFSFVVVDQCLLVHDASYEYFSKEHLP